MTSGLYAYDSRPPDDYCWMCHHDLPADRQGLIPALCGEKCTERWAAAHSLSIATHEVTETDWVPLVPRPKPAPGVVHRTL